jgi:mono/diheme cytochrome c family protein
MSRHSTIRKFVYGIAVLVIVIILTACQAEEVTEPVESDKDIIDTAPPLVIFSTDDFAGSGNCATCHSDLTDTNGNDVSIDSHWRSTMMANAAKDPFWQAKVASEVDRNPHLREVIEDKCATCHMPMAYTQANVDDFPTTILNDGFLDPANTLHKAAMDGNSCTLCHQIIDPVLGKYHIDTTTEPPDRLIYGPFESPQKLAMQTHTDFKPVYSEHVSESVLCGTCH